jgi:hypothetical protein
MMFLQLVWVTLMVPETKGVPLEEMQERLAGKAILPNTAPGLASSKTL